MGVYRVAEVCPNGHVSTDSADAFPDLREKFCSKCGEPTLTQCPNCKANIRGDYYVEGFIDATARYKPPAFCHNCGAAFPWTERKVQAAVDLVGASGQVSAEELSQFRDDLGNLTKESPSVQVASIRFKKIMIKVGKSVADSVREIIVDVLSEAGKRPYGVNPSYNYSSNRTLACGSRRLTQALAVMVIYAHLD